MQIEEPCNIIRRDSRGGIKQARKLGLVLAVLLHFHLYVPGCL
jgi:hypothetical protein